MISLFAYREITVRDLPALLLEAISLSAAVLVIVATAIVFSWIIASLGAPQMLDAWFRGVTDSPIVFLAIVNVFLLVIGMFMESISAILIILPVLMPIAASYGIDPVQFGVMAGLNLSVGLITPPYGICLFVAATVAGRKVEQVSSRVRVPLAPMILVLLLLTAYVPTIRHACSRFDGARGRPRNERNGRRIPDGNLRDQPAFRGGGGAGEGGPRARCRVRSNTMNDLTITIAGDRFGARLETANAPQTCKAFLAQLPLVAGPFMSAGVARPSGSRSATESSASASRTPPAIRHRAR